MSSDCTGQHRYFVAESGIVEAEGTVCVIIVCLECGDSKLIKHNAANITLNKKEK